MLSREATPVLESWPLMVLSKVHPAPEQKKEEKSAVAAEVRRVGDRPGTWLRNALLAGTAS